jgi:hypothetical protein
MVRDVVWKVWQLVEHPYLSARAFLLYVCTWRRVVCTRIDVVLQLVKIALPVTVENPHTSVVLLPFAGLSVRFGNVGGIAYHLYPHLAVLAS